MFNLLGGSSVNRGHTPKTAATHLPSCARLAVLLGQWAAHLNSVFLGIRTSGHKCPGQRGEQEEHWDRSTTQSLPRPSLPILDPGDQDGPFWLFEAMKPTVEGARTKGEGLLREAIIG